MRARDLMSTPAVVTHVDTPVKTAEKLLGEPHRGARTVREVMSVPVRTADVDDDAAAVAKIVLQEHIRCLPVLDRGKLAGVVTRRDFVSVLARPDQMLGHDVRRRLTAFGGVGRWVVDVRDGEVTVLDRYDSERDRQVAVALAESVPGVIRAHCYVGELEHQEERS